MSLSVRYWVGVYKWNALCLARHDTDRAWHRGLLSRHIRQYCSTEWGFVQN